MRFFFTEFRLLTEKSAHFRKSGKRGKRLANLPASKHLRMPFFSRLNIRIPSNGMPIAPKSPRKYRVPKLRKPRVKGDDNKEMSQLFETLYSDDQ